MEPTVPPLRDGVAACDHLEPVLELQAATVHGASRSHNAALALSAAAVPAIRVDLHVTAPTC